MARRHDAAARAGLPARGYVFVSVLFVVALVIATSIAIFVFNARLGYSYAVHSAIFFPLDRGNRLYFLVGAIAAGVLAYVAARMLQHRHRQKMKLVPWWVRLVLAGALAMYVIEVLEINISFAPSDEYASGTRPS